MHTLSAQLYCVEAVLSFNTDTDTHAQPGFKACANGTLSFTFLSPSLPWLARIALDQRTKRFLPAKAISVGPVESYTCREVARYCSETKSIAGHGLAASRELTVRGSACTCDVDRRRGPTSVKPTELSICGHEAAGESPPLSCLLGSMFDSSLRLERGGSKLISSLRFSRGGSTAAPACMAAVRYEA